MDGCFNSGNPSRLPCSTTPVTSVFKNGMLIAKAGLVGLAGGGESRGCCLIWADMNPGNLLAPASLSSRPFLPLLSALSPL